MFWYIPDVIMHERMPLHHVSLTRHSRNRAPTVCLAIIAVMKARSQVTRGARGRPSDCKTCKSLLTLFQFAHLRRRKRNTYGARVISRTYRFICCPHPDNCSRTHQGCTRAILRRPGCRNTSNFMWLQVLWTQAEIFLFFFKRPPPPSPLMWVTGRETAWY